LPTYLEWVAALPGVSQALLRAALAGRSAYCLDASEDLQTLTVVDPSSGEVPLYIIQSGRIFEFDATDATTAHDGTTCLVSDDGKRFKVETFEYPHSVLDKDLTAPPVSPSVGDRYIVGVASTGSWSGKDNQVAVYTERGWRFVTVPIGKFIYVEDETAFYHRNASGTWTAGVGSVAIGAGTVKPSALVGGGARVHWIVENQTTTAPPGTVTDGVAYIIGAGATGAWAGHDAKIAHGESGAWIVYPPAEGWSGYNKALDKRILYSGSAWTSGADAWELLWSKTLSGDSQVDIVHGVDGVVLDGTYGAYELRISGLKVGTDDQPLHLLVGTGAGPTWASANYYWGFHYSSRDIAGNDGSGSDSKIRMTLAAALGGVGNAAGEKFNGKLTFDNPSASDLCEIMIDAQYSAAGSSSYRVVGGGRLNSAGAITGFRIKAASGLLAAGLVELVALRKN